MVRSFACVCVLLAGVFAAAPVMAGDSPIDAVQLGDGRAAALFVPRAQDRRGTLTLEDGRNAWIRGAAQRTDAHGNSTLLQMGTDVVQSSHVLLGVIVGSSRTDGRAASTVSGQPVRARVHGTAVGVYGTWLQQIGWGGWRLSRCEPAGRAVPQPCGRHHPARSGPPLAAMAGVAGRRLHIRLAQWRVLALAAAAAGAVAPC